MCAEAGLQNNVRKMGNDGSDFKFVDTYIIHLAVDKLRRSRGAIKFNEQRGYYLPHPPMG